ncbi:carbonic anhydrase [Nocardiopsis salina]|uniref:carbonic anhydrase n=1 Tax=Nocardiopsis salina TaxID=245836 RepID=UPI00034AD0EB|nr:carbonic anhydrase [Nocardiopsis salina]
MAIAQRAAPERAALTKGHTADRVRVLLDEGNARWRTFTPRYPHQDSGRRRALWEADAEHPYASVLGCADSRVPPEMLFDRGLGDLYTVRAYGQVPDSSVAGSLVHGVRDLATPLLVVLGHSRCSAVREAVTALSTGRIPEGHTGFLVEGILDAIENVPDDGSRDFLDACVRANTVHVADQLRHEPGLRELVHSGELRIEPAHFSIKRSRVEWLGDRPEYRPGPEPGVPSQRPPGAQ